MAEVFDCIVEKPVNKGQCIVRINGKIAFVTGVIPGEKVCVQVEENKKSYYNAKLLKVILASPNRVKSYWPEGQEKGLGGMELAHMDYATQLKFKTDVLHDCFQRIGGQVLKEQLAKLDPIVVRQLRNTDPNVTDENAYLARKLHIEPIDPNTHLHWRTRMSFVVASNGHLGMSKYHSNDIIPITTMPLASKTILNSGALSENFVLKNKVAPNDIVQIATDNQGEVFYSVNGNYYNSCGQSTNKNMLQSVITLFEDQLDYEVQPDSFWQIHPKAPSTLVNIVLKAMAGLDFSAYTKFDPKQIGAKKTPAQLRKEIADNLAGKTVLELYSGSGLFSKAIAKYIGEKGKILSIEGSKSATENAEKNLQGYKNHKAIKANIDKNFIQKIAQKHQNFDIVVADPSRSGCGKEVIKSIADHIKPEKIVYVSCDPATLTRDLKVALEHGYELSQLVCYDLFPHTFHVETVCLMTRVR